VIVAGGSIIEDATLEGLAAKAKIDVAGLLATVASYNDSVKNGTTEKLAPARTTTPMPPFPIAKPPFKAMPVCAGITYTMGGIAIDGDARALDAHNRPIPGLFAAGAACGGLEGGKYTGYTGGLSKASIFGLIAAETIAGSTKPGAGAVPQAAGA
jgi:fumarate reductase flavoprotein subunit